MEGFCPCVSSKAPQKRARLDGPVLSSTEKVIKIYSVHTKASNSDHGLFYL